jgi:hypothetical protein
MQQGEKKLFSWGVNLISRRSYNDSEISKTLAIDPQKTLVHAQAQKTILHGIMPQTPLLNSSFGHISRAYIFAMLELWIFQAIDESICC